MNNKKHSSSLQFNSSVCLFCSPALQAVYCHKEVIKKKKKKYNCTVTQQKHVRAITQPLYILPIYSLLSLFLHFPSCFQPLHQSAPGEESVLLHFPKNTTRACLIYKIILFCCCCCFK